MDKPTLPALQRAELAVRENALQKADERAAAFGLTLSEAQRRALIASEAKTLRDYGRLEFGEGVLPRLVDAFADSPLIAKSEYCATLDTLQELFYAYHNEMDDQLSDEELVEAMQKLFHGRAQGSLEYMENISVIHLIRALNDADNEYDTEDDDGSSDD